MDPLDYTANSVSAGQIVKIPQAISTASTDSLDAIFGKLYQLGDTTPYTKHSCDYWTLAAIGDDKLYKDVYFNIEYPC
jgi:hypothetical protein